jgi:four helix bundle protein
MNSINSNIEARNTKQTEAKYEARKSKPFDLEERTLVFTRNVINYIKSLPKTMGNIEIGKQLIRSAGSVGANYIEANESLSKKDFIMRIKISKKEAKESLYWLKLTEPATADLGAKAKLVQEAVELMNILGAIYRKSVT